jgi:hypothetical protein
MVCWFMICKSTQEKAPLRMFYLRQTAGVIGQNCHFVNGKGKVTTSIQKKAMVLNILIIL